MALRTSRAFTTSAVARSNIALGVLRRETPCAIRHSSLERGAGPPRRLEALWAPSANSRRTRLTTTLPHNVRRRAFSSEKDDTASRASSEGSEPHSSSAAGARNPSPMPSILDTARSSTIRDCARWILFASAFTVGTVFACAIATNEISERMLEEWAQMLEEYDYDVPLDQFVADNGNSALRAIFQFKMWRLQESFFDIFRRSGPAPKQARESDGQGAQENNITQEDLDLAQAKLKDQRARARETLSSLINQLHLYPDVCDRKAVPRLIVSTVLLRAFLSALLHSRRFGPAIERIIPTHNPYSSRSYSLLTSLLRFQPGPHFTPRVLCLTIPTFALAAPFGLSFLPAIFVQESEGSPSDLMEATFIGRSFSLILSASVCANAVSSIVQRIKGDIFVRRGLLSAAPVLRHIAGVRGAVAALALYPMLVAGGPMTNWGADEWNVVDAYALTCAALAAAYSPAGAACALAYAAVGQATFDAARRAAFSPARYPLLQQVRPQHAATAEKRALQAAEYAKSYALKMRHDLDISSRE